MNRVLVSLFLIPALTSANGDTPPPKTNTAAKNCASSYEAKDHARARETCASAARAGNSHAQYLLGRMYEEGDGVTKDSAAAVKWYRLAAESGHAVSQRRLAGAYALGRGVEKDEKLGLYWIQEAAKNGDRRAQKQLAVGYQYGIGGLPRDENLSRQWRERAEKNQH